MNIQFFGAIRTHNPASKRPQTYALEPAATESAHSAHRQLNSVQNSMGFFSLLVKTFLATAAP
jgi:hypothetical protein